MLEMFWTHCYIWFFISITDPLFFLVATGIPSSTLFLCGWYFGQHSAYKAIRKFANDNRYTEKGLDE